MKGDLDILTISVKGSGGYDAGDRVEIEFFDDAALATTQRLMPAVGISDRSYWRDGDDGHRFSSLTELLQWVEKALTTNDITLPGRLGGYS